MWGFGLDVVLTRVWARFGGFRAFELRVSGLRLGNV